MDHKGMTVFSSAASGKAKMLKMVILGGAVLFPLLYIYFKTADIPDLPKEPDAEISLQQPADDAASNDAKPAGQSFDDLINASMSYINKQVPEKSIPYLFKAIAINPRSAVAYNNLCVAYLMQQQIQMGIDACTKALQIDPQFQLAKNNLAWGQDLQSKAEAEQNK